jgi:hypothetical protein
MNKRMPDQDNIQERLKRVQEECQRLREENADLRAMLGINQSAPKEPVPQAVPVSNLSSTTRTGVSTPEEKISLFRNLFRGREDVFRHSLGRQGRQIWLFTCRHHGLACHPVARPEERKKVARKSRMLQIWLELDEGEIMHLKRGNVRNKGTKAVTMLFFLIGARGRQ